MSRFQPATNVQSKARIGIAGPAGSGKTMTALKWARALAGPEGRVAVIDTEHGTAAKYADPDGEPWQQFDHAVLTSFGPLEYVSAINDANDEGYDALVIDSATHAWSGKGGALHQVDQYATQHRGDKFGAWREVTPQHNDMVEAMLGARAHLIVTMRSKMEYALRKDEDSGRHRVEKLGMAPIQRDGMEYEFDLIVDMDVDNNGQVGKTRCPAMKKAWFHEPGADDLVPFIDWLNKGVDPEREAAKVREQALAVWDDAQALWRLLDHATARGLHQVTVEGVSDVLAGEARTLADIITTRGRFLVAQQAQAGASTAQPPQGDGQN